MHPGGFRVATWTGYGLPSSAGSGRPNGPAPEGPGLTEIRASARTGLGHPAILVVTRRVSALTGLWTGRSTPTGLEALAPGDPSA